MGKIYAAKTNHITNPLGFYLKPLVFSWKVKGGRGQEQKHARIVISKNKTFTDICHDTGEAELDSLSARVEFEPQPYTRYYWKVIVTTDAEEVIESDTQFFETAKMDEPWTGRWITCDSSQERHPIFSKRIRPAKEVKSARLYICGLGLYEAWVDYIRRIDGDHHGWRQIFHYGDWLALDRTGAAANSVYGATDEAYIADIYYAASAQTVAKAADVLGLEETRQEYQEIADRQWRAVKEEYFTSTGRCAVKTQTGLILALKYHLSENEELTKQMMKKLLRDNKNKLNTGFVGTPLLCNVLTDHGMTDAAYRLLLNEEYPGWLYEVKLGATTVWERWNSLDENGHVSSTGMNSLNHYSYGAVLEWIFCHAAGIDVTEQSPGGRVMRISPKVNRGLGYVKAVYDSACGCYQCGWEILGDNKITVTVTVPFGGRAEVVLPLAPESVYEDKENPLFEDVENGICRVKAGEYEVAYEASQPLKRKYSIDSTMEELLNHPDIRAFLSQMMEVDMIPDIAYGLSLRDVAKTFAGEIKPEEAQMLDIALANF